MENFWQYCCFFSILAPSRTVNFRKTQAIGFLLPPVRSKVLPKNSSKNQTIFPKNGNISALGEYSRLPRGQLPPRKRIRRRDFSCAKRFPLSPCRESVKPPLLVPVFRDRLLSCPKTSAIDSPMSDNRQNPRFRFANDSEDRYITMDGGCLRRTVCR